jgi:tetratricopeptide (TPR) repeat protein
LRLISGRRKQIRIGDLERVETHATRTLRRGGRVRYRYRTQIVGKCTEFTFASGRGYRQMVQRLFPLLHNDKLDLRTMELRDYLCDPKTLNSEVQLLQLASDEVLQSATLDFKLAGQQKETSPDAGSAEPAIDVRRATLLGALGNRLRIAGRLNEAREAFRRSLGGVPADGQIIFDFARLLRSQAASLSDSKLLSRSRAAMRLSAMRAGQNANLLALIGEAFLEWGDTQRAYTTFHRALDLHQENFRARLGLASLALREGKLAHVIHHFRDAARSTSERALLDYARREADYYARLNDDDQYLTSELRRINWLQHSLRIRRLAARVTNASILGALLGPYIDPTISGICWSLATSSLSAWIISLFAIKFLGKRSTPRLAN